MNKIEQIIKYICDTKNFVSVHTTTLFITLYVTVDSYRWAGEFAYKAYEKGTAGTEIAAIVLAVTAPISLLQKAVFDRYSTSRKI